MMTETGVPVLMGLFFEASALGGERACPADSAFQGQGIAGRATAQAIARARADGKHRLLHAFTSVENPPLNALCRKLGFTLLGECEFEYPKGHFMRRNDWRLDLL